MRVLGITPTSNDVSWAVVEGSRSKPTVVPTDSTKQKFPAGKDESSVLHDLYRFALSFLQDKAIEEVVILQAGTSKFGNASSTRIKTEAAFQIACTERNVPVKVVHPNSLRSQIKKFESETGDTPEAIFNDGNDFRPKPWKDTVLVGWMGLNA